MATTPIASLVACSWCGLLAERGPICDACGSPVAETTGRTTVLRVPEAGERFAEALRASRQPTSARPAQAAPPSPVHPEPSPQPGAPTATPPASSTRRAARWLNVNQASVMSGVPERTLRGWVSSRTPEDVVINEGDPRFLLIRTPALKLPDGMWMVDGPTSSVAPTAAPAAAVPLVQVDVHPPVAPVASVPRPDVPTVAPVARGTTPPPPPKPEPPVRAPIVAMPAHPAAPAPATKPAAPPEQPAPLAHRGPVLSDMYLAALLAEDVLPETWGFDSSPDERKLFRRHKLLTTTGVVLGFAGVAELIDFLMSHLH